MVKLKVNVEPVQIQREFVSILHDEIFVICVRSQLCICLKQKFGCFRCNPTDALFKRAGNWIRGVLGDYMRGKRTEDLLGCNKYEYFEYIQSKFVGDMSFER